MAQVVHHQQRKGAHHDRWVGFVTGHVKVVAGIAGELVEQLRGLRQGQDTAIVHGRLRVQRQHVRQIFGSGLADAQVQDAGPLAPASSWRSLQ